MLTDEHVLAAYAEGNDLEAFAPTLREAFAQFAASRRWPTDQVLVVDSRKEPDPNEPEFLPDWDLGLNLGLDHISHDSEWFAGVEAVVTRLRKLSADTDCDFVLFLCFRSQMWRQEHLVYVSSGPVDLEWLRGALERLIKR